MNSSIKNQAEITCHIPTGQVKKIADYINKNPALKAKVKYEKTANNLDEQVAKVEKALWKW